MKDFILEAPDQNRYTYFFAFYGKEFKQRSGLLHVQHDFRASTKKLHLLIRKRINEVLGADTLSSFHIVALATPDPIHCSPRQDGQADRA
jgi:hypothetical protein